MICLGLGKCNIIAPQTQQREEEKNQGQTGSIRGQGREEGDVGHQRRGRHGHAQGGTREDRSVTNTHLPVQKPERKGEGEVQTHS